MWSYKLHRVFVAQIAYGFRIRVILMIVRARENVYLQLIGFQQDGDLTAEVHLRNESGAVLRWIADTEELKPGVHMPAFDMLPDQELRALAAYLEGLR